MNDEVVGGLRKLGLTEYEAKSYAALVGLGEASAREVHEASGIPRTRAAATLDMCVPSCPLGHAHKNRSCSVLSHARQMKLFLEKAITFARMEVNRDVPHTHRLG